MQGRESVMMGTAEWGQHPIEMETGEASDEGGAFLTLGKQKMVFELHLSNICLLESPRYFVQSKQCHREAEVTTVTLQVCTSGVLAPATHGVRIDESGQRCCKTHAAFPGLSAEGELKGYLV